MVEFLSKQRDGSRLLVSDAKNYIRDHVTRLKGNNSINLSTEILAIELEKNILTNLLSGATTDRLVAFFAFEGGKNTIILMPVDTNGKFVVDAGGCIPYERWDPFTTIVDSKGHSLSIPSARDVDTIPGALDPIFV